MSLPLGSWNFLQFLAFLHPLSLFLVCKADKKHVKLQKFHQTVFLQYSKTWGNRLVTETCLWDWDWKETWNLSILTLTQMGFETPLLMDISVYIGQFCWCIVCCKIPLIYISNMCSQKLLCYCSAWSVRKPKLLLRLWLVNAKSLSSSLWHGALWLHLVVHNNQNMQLFW